MFWRLFAHFFFRHLLIFAALIAWVLGVAWGIDRFFPALPVLVSILLSTVLCAVLASAGRVFILRNFNW